MTTYRMIKTSHEFLCQLDLWLKFLKAAHDPYSFYEWNNSIARLIESDVRGYR